VGNPSIALRDAATVNNQMQPPGEPVADCDCSSREDLAALRSPDAARIGPRNREIAVANLSDDQPQWCNCSSRAGGPDASEGLRSLGQMDERDMKCILPLRGNFQTLGVTQSERVRTGMKETVIGITGWQVLRSHMRVNSRLSCSDHSHELHTYLTANHSLSMWHNSGNIGKL
jgi:hypothetical protein